MSARNWYKLGSRRSASPRALRSCCFESSSGTQRWCSGNQGRGQLPVQTAADAVGILPPGRVRRSQTSGDKGCERSIITEARVMAPKRLAPIHPGEVLLHDFLEPLELTQYR